MPAFVAATVTSFQMIIRGEDHQAIVEIKIARHDLDALWRIVFRAQKFHDAIAADAAFIFQFCRHAREQGFGNLHFRAPTRAFVSRVGAKLAIVRLAAQRALCGVKIFCR